MDIRAYIESGIIESYVLGLAEPAEAAELQMLCAQHPEIKAALNAFEIQMEAQAFNDAITPRPELKDRLMHMLSDEFASEKNEEKLLAPVISIGNEKIQSVSSGAFWKYFAAASVILFVASAALNLYLYNNYNSATVKYQALLTERNSLLVNNDVFRTRLNSLEESFKIIQNPDFIKVALPGVKGKETNLAAVYWNKKTNDVYLLPTKMDEAPQGKQYQLWAIVNGKPVDAGLMEDCNGLCKMKNISGAQAFAITLENKGGSPAPHLEALYVMGAVNG